MIKKFRDDKSFNDEVWIFFGGDKGGGSTKFHFEIINDQASGSRDAVHTYCLFEAPDSSENISKMLSSYRPELIKLQDPNFKLNVKKVKIFLGGDYDFLNKSVGHQGQASTYPSLTDLVTLEHLRRHVGSPHSQETCNVEKRDSNDYILNFSENLQDDRNSKNRRKNGHEHNSVVGAMIFPLADMSHLVPAILHIHLGIVLEIFNTIDYECSLIDDKNKHHAASKNKEKANLKREIRNLSKDFVKIQKQIVTVSSCLIDLNRRFLLHQNMTTEEIGSNVISAPNVSARKK